LKQKNGFVISWKVALLESIARARKDLEGKAGNNNTELIELKHNVAQPVTHLLALLVHRDKNVVANETEEPTENHCKSRLMRETAKWGRVETISQCVPNDQYVHDHDRQIK
jgi:hypothetical protein